MNYITPEEYRRQRELNEFITPFLAALLASSIPITDSELKELLRLDEEERSVEELSANLV